MGEERKAAWSDPRILQANERTYLAWLRTGIALMAFGFVIAKFYLFLEFAIGPRERGKLPPLTGMSTYLGGALSLVGVAIQILALWRYRRIHARLLRGEQGVGSTIPSYVGAVLIAFGILIALYLLGT